MRGVALPGAGVFEFIAGVLMTIIHFQPDLPKALAHLMIRLRKLLAHSFSNFQWIGPFIELRPIRGHNSSYLGHYHVERGDWAAPEDGDGADRG